MDRQWTDQHISAASKFGLSCCCAAYRGKSGITEKNGEARRKIKHVSKQTVVVVYVSIHM